MSWSRRLTLYSSRYRAKTKRSRRSKTPWFSLTRCSQAQLMAKQTAVTWLWPKNWKNSKKSSLTGFLKCRVISQFSRVWETCPWSCKKLSNDLFRRRRARSFNLKRMNPRNRKHAQKHADVISHVKSSRTTQILTALWTACKNLSHKTS